MGLDTSYITTLDSPLPNQIQTIAYTMVDSMIRTHFLDENNFSFTHSHTYSTRPVVAWCVLHLRLKFTKAESLSIISNTEMFSKIYECL